MNAARTFRRFISVAIMVAVGSLLTAMPAAGDVVPMSVSIATLIQMSIDNSSVNLGVVAPGFPQTGETVVTVSTNSEHGYEITAAQDSGQTHTLQHENSTDHIEDKADFDGTAGTTAIWTGTGFGITVFQATEKNTSIWGTGDDEEDSNNRYTGLPSTPIAIHEVSTNVVSDETHIGYKVDVHTAQYEGAYDGIVTISATVIP